MVKRERTKKTDSVNEWLFISFVASAIFFVDQITKLLVRKLQPFTNNGLLDITLTTNTGSLFGLFNNFAHSNVVFIVLSVIAVSLLFLVFREENNTKLYFPLGMVIGGIMGNFVDRIFFGAVIDWIRVPRWPVFNISDAALVLGVVLLLFFTIREENANHKTTKNTYIKNKKKVSSKKTKKKQR